MNLILRWPRIPLLPKCRAYCLCGWRIVLLLPPFLSDKCSRSLKTCQGHTMRLLPSGSRRSKRFRNLIVLLPQCCTSFGVHVVFLLHSCVSTPFHRVPIKFKASCRVFLTVFFGFVGGGGGSSRLYQFVHASTRISDTYPWNHMERADGAPKLELVARCSGTVSCKPGTGTHLSGRIRPLDHVGGSLIVIPSPLITSSNLIRQRCTAS